MKIDQPWIQTYSGIQFTPFDVKPEDISIEDIAHSLSMQCRFNGHVFRFYSVAQHALNASYIVPEQYAMEALLHDAAEYIIGDLARPIKAEIPQYKHIDRDLTSAIEHAFALDHSDGAHAAVKIADNWLVHEEADRYLKHDLKEFWDWPKPTLEVPESPDLIWGYLAPGETYPLFMERFYELSSARLRTIENKEAA